MSTPAPADYTIVSQVHKAKWNEGTQSAQEGWEVTAKWYKTGTFLTVFLPDDVFTAANVDAAIRHQGATAESVAALGG